MSKKKIKSVEQARELLVKAVEDRGVNYTYDYKFDSAVCRYVHRDGEPGCIIGHVLEQMGRLDEVEYDTTLNTSGVDTLHHEIGLFSGVEKETLFEGLQSAQGEQDSGGTWGKALQAFDWAVEHERKYRTAEAEAVA